MPESNGVTVLCQRKVEEPCTRAAALRVQGDDGAWQPVCLECFREIQRSSTRLIRVDGLKIRGAA